MEKMLKIPSPEDVVGFVDRNQKLIGCSPERIRDELQCQENSSPVRVLGALILHHGTTSVESAIDHARQLTTRLVDLRKHLKPGKPVLRIRTFGFDDEVSDFAAGTAVKNSLRIYPPDENIDSNLGSVCLALQRRFPGSNTPAEESEIPILDSERHPGSTPGETGTKIRVGVGGIHELLNQLPDPFEAKIRDNFSEQGVHIKPPLRQPDLSTTGKGRGEPGYPM